MQYKQQLLENGKTLLYAWFEAMYTRFDIAISIDNEQENLLPIINEIENEVEKFEKIANRFNPESELSYSNENAINTDTKISAELCDILTECQSYNLQTNGYFDISVYSENGFGTYAGSYFINTEKNTIRYSHDKIQLDLSGFIKGYVLGKVSVILEKNGIENALINFGNSSIMAKGNHPFGNGWKVSVPSTEIEQILINECLTTSGNSDITKWPIKNPKNGEIKNKQIVSVVTSNPAIGEVLSKVAYIAPEVELNQILQTFNGRIAL